MRVHEPGPGVRWTSPKALRLGLPPDERRGAISVEERGAVLVGRLTGTTEGEVAPGIIDDLADLVDLAEDSPSVRAVVLVGTHPEWFLADAGPAWPRLRDAGRIQLFHDTLLRMNGADTLFVAALNGSALGAGFELALACDLRVMADGPHVIGPSEPWPGAKPGGGGTQRLARLIGSHRALRQLLVGIAMDPVVAFDLGAVDRIVSAGELLPAAVELATSHGVRDKATVGAVKRCVWFGTSMELEDGLALERAEFLRLWTGPTGGS